MIKLKIPEVFKGKKKNKKEKPSRAEEGHKVIAEKKAKREQREQAQLKLEGDAKEFFEVKAEETGMSVPEVINKVIENDVMLIEFNETTGKASLVFKSWASPSTTLGENQPLSQKIISEFRKLRENFAPVSAGIEWHRDFTCYDKETEVLTEDGWKLFKDLNDGDKVATLNSNGELEYQKPLRRMTYDYNGRLWKFKNQQIDLLVTPNHKILRRTVGRDRFNKSFELMKVTDVIQYQKTEMKKNAKWNGEDIEFHIPITIKRTSDVIKDNIDLNDWLEFFGYWLSEGSATAKSNDYVIKISQSKKVHPKTYEKIRKCIERLGYNYYANEKYFTISNKQLYLYLNQFGKSWQKFIPKEIKQLPQEKLGILYNALIDGDGVRYKDTNGYSSTSKRLIDDMQEILLKLGFAGNIHSCPMRDSYIKGRKVIAKHQRYRIFEIDYRGLTPVILRKDIEPIHYNGKIYSCEVPNHILYVRRNGTPIWSGNSGGGFIVQTNDPNDKHKIMTRDEVKQFCRDVYQDQYTTGLDNILDIMMDTALTDGCSAAEIVYDEEVEFMDYVSGFENVVMKDKEGKDKVVKVMTPKEPDWHGTLKRITRLKIIDDAYNRLRPYRHPKSGEVLFWSLDEKVKSEWTNKKTIAKNSIKFHPWEIFWLSWNQRGTNLKGMSLIQPVYTIAKFVQAIQKAVGVGFNRWANKKYFFVLGTEKRPWSKPAQTAFLKAMGQMIKNNYIGIPVPAGFDIKNIGGEGTVFEGQNLLNYLTGQICTGMQYPREFLEVGKGTQSASSSSWLAWTVRYGRNQRQVKRAIEQQLFKRQLWCLHGKKYRVSKKGVPRTEQEQRDVYIPKLQWRAEGRWHRERKMELLTSTLNVANPADPPLKLGVEKLMCDILGLGELDWETTIKLHEIRTESQLLEAKLNKLTAEAKLKEAEELGVEGLLKRLKEREKAKLAQPVGEKPVKVPTEEELTRRGEERLAGGVSRTDRGAPTQKGKARPMGGTREPKRVAETIPQLPNITIVQYPKELTESMMETEKIKQEKIKAEFERQQKKIEMLDELEERMKKKKKLIRKEESKPLPFVSTGRPFPIKEKPKSEPQKVKLDINVKSEPVKTEVDVNVKSPKEIEETKQKAKAELELIKQRKVFLETQKEMLEEEKKEKEKEKLAKKKLRERKKKVLEKIEKKVEEK